jgi:hypothetical protein
MTLSFHRTDHGNLLWTYQEEFHAPPFEAFG